LAKINEFDEKTIKTNIDGSEIAKRIQNTLA
jgi:hypothetical protein